MCKGRLDFIELLQLLDSTSDIIPLQISNGTHFSCGGSVIPKNRFVTQWEKISSTKCYNKQ